MADNTKRILVDFEPISRRVALEVDKTIYELLTKLGVQIRSLCGGKGTCGKCKILIQDNTEHLIHPSESEIKLVGKEEIEKGWRLACQTRVKEDSLPSLAKKKQPQFRIFLPDELLLEDFKILTEGVFRKVELNPTIKKIYAEVKKPTLEEPFSDFDRIISSFKLDKDIEFNSEFLKSIPDILRKQNHQITLSIWNQKRIVSIEPGNTCDANYGIAFDIGTTTIVGYLINLNDGKIYAVASSLNPQTAYGEDVVTRITYIKDNEDGLQKLNSAVIQALNNIILKTCEKANISPSQIYEATIVGNSVMHHIFLGLSPISIGVSPFIPVVQQALNEEARNLNLNIAPQGNVYALPIIAGFVGADTMGVIISSNIEKETQTTLALDIGTNGEIIIGNQDFIATASCAAGSALEGAHIKHGMRAAAGSIDTLKINPKTFEVSYTTIKNKPAIGLCGSGLIDTVAELLRAKILTRSGNFNKEFLNSDVLFRNSKDELEFTIVKSKESEHGNISITQDDIRQIQMAKGAFYSGNSILLKYVKGASNIEIKQIFLAGAFGNYINKENAKFIGMIPDIPSERIFQIGNAAGTGAQHCLLNKDLRKKAQDLLKKIQYIEIATKKEFQMEFAEAMYFPHRKLELFPSLKEYEDIKIR